MFFSGMMQLFKKDLAPVWHAYLDDECFQKQNWLSTLI